MSEDLTGLLEIFDGTGLSRGTMNGKPLGFVSDPEGGYRATDWQEQFLKGLRAYEKRNGTARSYKESVKMQMRAEVAAARAKKRAREAL